MYGNKDVVADLEDMLMDFLMYRKHKYAPQINIQSNHQIGKGWPHYKEMQALPLPELEAPQEKDDLYDMDTAVKNILPKPLLSPDDEKDIESIKLLYSDINKKLDSYVEQVLRRTRYKGTYINDDNINRDSVEVMASLVLEMASNDLAEVAAIVKEPERHPWSKHHMLRAIVEGLILHNLYRRPKLFGLGFIESHTDYL